MICTLEETKWMRIWQDRICWSIWWSFCIVLAYKMPQSISTFLSREWWYQQKHLIVLFISLVYKMPQFWSEKSLCAAHGCCRGNIVTTIFGRIGPGIASKMKWPQLPEKVVLGFGNFAWGFFIFLLKKWKVLRIGSGGSSLHRPGSKDPHWR